MDAFYICQVPFPLGPTFILGRNHAFHEPSEAPPGFGVRQSSGALAMEASQSKAPEDWRSPRRYRAIRRFMIPMPARKPKETLASRITHHASRLWLILLLLCSWNVARADDVSTAFDQANKLYE